MSYFSPSYLMCPRKEADWLVDINSLFRRKKTHVHLRVTLWPSSVNMYTDMGERLFSRIDTGIELLGVHWGHILSMRQ